jgi:hypothetical protein
MKTAMKRALWIVLALLVAVAALEAALWGWAFLKHKPLRTLEDFSSHALWREMPEGAVLAVLGYDVAGAFPPEETLWRGMELLAARGNIAFSREAFERRYTLLKPMLGGELAFALYPGEGGEERPAFWLAARPRPSARSLFQLTELCTQAWALWKTAFSDESLPDKRLPDGTPVYLDHRRGTFYAAAFPPLQKGVRAGEPLLDAQAREGWRATLREGDESGRDLSGVAVARFGEQRAWGIFHLQAGRCESRWSATLAEEDAALCRLAARPFSLPPEAEEEAALLVQHALSLGALNPDDFEHNFPLDLGTALDAAAALRALCVFAPEGGAALPGTALYFVPEPAKQKELSGFLNSLLYLGTWLVEEQSGGILSPEIRRERRDGFTVASLPLGMFEPCYAEREGLIVASLECGRLDSLLEIPRPSAPDAELFRVELRGAPLSESLRALGDLAALVGRKESVPPAVLEALARIEHASFGVEAPSDDVSLDYLTGRLSVEWNSFF